MPPEVALLESRALRDSVSTRTDVLDRVKALTMLPDDTHVTSRMVADYYEVAESVISSLVIDHRDEVVANGYRVLTGAELTQIKRVCGIPSSRSRSMALFPRRAVLSVGLLLRDSPVARRVRTYLLDAEAAGRQDPVAMPPSWGMPPGRRLGPGPHWDEYEYLRAHPEAQVPEQYPDYGPGQWADWAQSVDLRLDAHGRVIGAMSEQLCRVSEDVRELRDDVSTIRQDMSGLRQGIARLNRRIR
ncbi:hypothetical protein [Streptacidiphilus sp. PAMC 29251]